MRLGGEARGGTGRSAVRGCRRRSDRDNHRPGAPPEALGRSVGEVELEEPVPVTGQTASACDGARCGGAGDDAEGDVRSIGRDGRRGGPVAVADAGAGTVGVMIAGGRRCGARASVSGRLHLGGVIRVRRNWIVVRRIVQSVPAPAGRREKRGGEDERKQPFRKSGPGHYPSRSTGGTTLTPLKRYTSQRQGRSSSMTRPGVGRRGLQGTYSPP